MVFRNIFKRIRIIVRTISREIIYLDPVLSCYINTRRRKIFYSIFPQMNVISRSSNTRKRDGFSFGGEMLIKKRYLPMRHSSRGDRLIKLFVRSTKLAGSLRSDFFFSLSFPLSFFPSEFRADHHDNLQ